MSRSLVVGVDAGATSTRCVVATLDGTVVGRGVAGGANPNSSGGDVAGALTAALRAALSTLDPTDVRLGVVGAAGSAGTSGTVQAAAAHAWAAAGLTGEVATVTDLEVAFVAGTPEPDGVLLLCGTGALAARFAGGALERRCDGYGWLLGDEGSAVWIGLRAVRAAVASLDGRGEPTALLDTVCREWEVGRPAGATAGELAQLLVAGAFARPPAAFGGLAPAVGAAAEAGDAVARGICDVAAGKLLHTFDAVGPPAGAVVLAGSVLLSPGPVARAVRAGLAERTAVTPGIAADGAGGAAAMAIARLCGERPPVAVHARLTAHGRRRG